MLSFTDCEAALPWTMRASCCGGISAAKTVASFAQADPATIASKRIELKTTNFLLLIPAFSPLKPWN